MANRKLEPDVTFIAVETKLLEETMDLLRALAVENRRSVSSQVRVIIEQRLHADEAAA